MPRRPLLDRVNAGARAATGTQKSWAGELPFWQSDQLRFPWLVAATAEREPIENDFVGYVEGAYKRNGIVFGAIDRRQQVFSQGRFQWRNWVNGIPSEFYGSAELALLEKPWPNGTTGELLAHMEYDASLAGNFYCTTVDDAGRTGRRATGPGRRIARMRPDWAQLVIGTPEKDGNPFGVTARVVALSYLPRTSGGDRNDELLLLPEEFVHYSPKPDPTARFRGMSWLTPIITEIMADKAATAHKLAYFENGAIPGLVVKGLRAATKEKFDELVDMMEERHAGSSNAYRSLYLTEGADATVVGSDLASLDYKVVQGGGETRLAVAGGVPAVILGISEGLAGSSLNAGNFQAARRLFVDTTIQDLWNKAAPSLAKLLTPPHPGAELAVDGRWIPFLRENEKDRADIQALEAQMIRNLLDSGWTPESVVAVAGPQWKPLVHSGLFSVQLQPPNSSIPTLGAGAPALNGSNRG
jgi:hypothetical protein